MKLYEIAGQYKTDIDTEDEIIALIKANCKDALKSINTPIVRGMTKMKNGFGIIHGEAGGRKSANTTNHYTVILDEALPDYPKRSASIICANWENRDYTYGYGKMHVIIPFDGVKIGICPERDMFYSEVKLGDRVQRIHRWNDFYENNDIRDDSFAHLVEDFQTLLERRDLWGIEDHKDHLAEYLKQEYSVPFDLATTATAQKYNQADQEHELWIGGKCIAIERDLFESMLEKLGADHETEI